jgi:hypothetical protein
MEFAEADTTWRAIPSWASFLIAFGFRWLEHEHSSRRIALISMPSDSAAAGLIALGAMRKCLELDDANDVGSHFQRIVQLAQGGDASVRLRYRSYRDQYALEPLDGDGFPWARNIQRPGNRVRINRSSALDWRFHGEAPVVTANGHQLPNAQFYQTLIREGGAIKSSNLNQSDSGICLAGRSIGEMGTRRCLAEVRFRQDGCETDLSKLLTVQHWMPGTISRVMFFNARTDEFDRGSGRPHLVIADGEGSFLKVVSRQEFEQCDVVGVIHRTMEREKLEEIGIKLANLRQWYDTDSDAIKRLPPTPVGITISTLKRRT